MTIHRPVNSTLITCLIWSTTHHDQLFYQNKKATCIKTNNLRGVVFTKWSRINKRLENYMPPYYRMQGIKISRGLWLPMQSVPISAYHYWCCEFESLSGRGVQHYVIKFVSDLRQVGGFPRVPPTTIRSRPRRPISPDIAGNLLTWSNWNIFLVKTTNTLHYQM
jgi:hypothetical protein